MPMRIDAHQHFWKIERDDYGWMDDSVAAIRRDFGPADLKPLLERCGLDGSIVVQAAPSIEESRYLLSLADENPAILGVVGWIELGADCGLQDLESFALHPKFKGIRPVLQDIAETDWILGPERLAALQQVAGIGLRFDALIRPRHLDVIVALADAIPTLPIVIDHCAKPVIRQGANAGNEWREGMHRLSEYPQVYCKLSGLANEYGSEWSSTSLEPVASYVLSIFGAERVMWGSDWPVLNLAGNYSDWHRCAEQLAAGLSHSEHADLFGATAARFYGISQACHEVVAADRSRHVEEPT
ncbi:MAG: amidohydrolase family protein [Rhizobiaceae bacterium]